MAHVLPYEALAGPCSSALGRPLTSAEADQADKYLKLLIKWQKSQRLVASSSVVWIAEHLFADSLLFLKLLPAPTSLLADVGSGAGFPAVPIKIVRPEVRVVLIESRHRRASFLRAVVRELGLQGVEVEDQRLESLAPGMAGVFDAVTMRCAGDPRLLLPSVLPILRPGGLVIASGPPADKPSQTDPKRTAEGKVDTIRLEEVLISGVGGRPRRFLVARKS